MNLDLIFDFTGRTSARPAMVGPASPRAGLVCASLQWTVAYCGSDSLSPPNGERVGVRGKHLRIKRLLTSTFCSIGNGGKGKNQIKALPSHEN